MSATALLSTHDERPILTLVDEAEERQSQLTEAMGRYADGDPTAFDVIYHAFFPIVLRCQRRWAGPALAEDLTQQTFLRIHRARERYRPGTPVGPWVLAIARHLAIDSLRKRGRSLESLTREGTLPETEHREAPKSGDDAQAVIEAVRAAVEALPSSQRSVVALHKLEERSFAEVADRLQINEGAARVRAHRAYARLREALATVTGLR